jgi:glutathione S-transferase
MVVEAALRMAGVPFEGVAIADKSALLNPDFLAINPAGKIPVLVLPSGQSIAESAAILLAANIYPAALRFYYPSRHTADAAPQAAEAIKAQAAKDMDRDFAQLATAVEGPFLLGETMTITDVYAAMLADWHGPAMAMPQIRDMVPRMLENAAVSDAWRNHEFAT